MGGCQGRSSPDAFKCVTYLHQVETAKPKLTSRIFTLGYVVSVIIYEPSLHARKETADGTDIREPFIREHPKCTGSDLRHSIG